MDLTLEVRWFYEGDIPDAVGDWFQTIGPEREAPRENVYMPSGDAAMNVKLREGKVQVKRREMRGAAMQLGDGVAGHPERWYKWSFPAAGDGLDLEEYRAPEGLWRYVTKERYRRVFNAGAQEAVLNGQDRAVDTAGAGVAQAALVDAAHAEVELTRVTVEEHVWWTLCVETEGARDALLPLLRPMSAHVFRHDGAPSLAAEHSYGYNQWLNMLFS